MSTHRPILSNYRDFDFEFATNALTLDVKTRTGLASIAQSVRNLLLTYPWERPFSNVGGGLLDFLFEPDTPQNILSMKERVFSLIKKHEKRILVDFNDIVIERQKDSSLKINIKYRMRGGLELEGPQNFSIILSGE